MEGLLKVGIIRLVESFLTDRSQCVRVNTALSSLIITDAEAPQGSTIFPVLFTLYTTNVGETHLMFPVLNLLVK